MIMIFTGNGKGKTTAAFGQTIRALGHGKRVSIIQFIKGPWVSGEYKFFDRIKLNKKNFKLVRAGKGFVKILGDKLPFSTHKNAAVKALNLAKKEINSKKWDLIILDEINVAVNLKLLNEKKVLDTLKCIYLCPCKSVSGPRRSAPTVILTGRNAPKSFIKEADLVTEMKEIKHPFQKRELAQESIDY